MKRKYPKTVPCTDCGRDAPRVPPGYPGDPVFLCANCKAKRYSLASVIGYARSRVEGWCLVDNHWNRKRYGDGPRLVTVGITTRGTVPEHVAAARAVAAKLRTVADDLEVALDKELVGGAR